MKVYEQVHFFQFVLLDMRSLLVHEGSTNQILAFFWDKGHKISTLSQRIEELHAKNPSVSDIKSVENENGTNELLKKNMCSFILLFLMNMERK